MKQLFIMRGLPGSGKSTIAQILRDGLISQKSNGVKILNADELRIVDGKYQFIPDHEPYVWEEFERLFQEALNEEFESIIIDNTNLRRINYETYTRDALEKGYIVHEIIVGDFNVSRSFALGKHEVPVDKLQAMKDFFEFPQVGKSI